MPMVVVVLPWKKKGRCEPIAFGSMVAVVLVGGDKMTTETTVSTQGDKESGLQCKR